MVDPRHCEEYERLLNGWTLLAVMQLCGARVACPGNPEEDLRQHTSACPKCRALAQKEDSHGHR